MTGESTNSLIVKYDLSPKLSKFFDLHMSIMMMEFIEYQQVLQDNTFKIWFFTCSILSDLRQKEATWIQDQTAQRYALNRTLLAILQGSPWDRGGSWRFLRILFSDFISSFISQTSSVGAITWSRNGRAARTWSRPSFKWSSAKTSRSESPPSTIRRRCSGSTPTCATRTRCV